MSSLSASPSANVRAAGQPEVQPDSARPETQMTAVSWAVRVHSLLAIQGPPADGADKHSNEAPTHQALVIYLFEPIFFPEEIAAAVAIRKCRCTFAKNTVQNHNPAYAFLSINTLINNAAHRFPDRVDLPTVVPHLAHESQPPKVMSAIERAEDLFFRFHPDTVPGPKTVSRYVTDHPL
jgi:hypothetical protein